MCYKGEYLMKKYINGEISINKYTRFMEQQKVNLIKGLERICNERNNNRQKAKISK